MSERFVIADPHFGHKGMVQFVKDCGNPIRPEWGRADPDRLMPDDEAIERTEAMNEAMVERWNAVVGPKDKVEVLGDVVINRRALAIFDRLNGKKRLRSGNHDIFHKDYPKYFSEISAYKVLNVGEVSLIMSHIPLHPESVKERWLGNIHGHLHTNRVMTKRHTGVMRRVAVTGRNIGGSRMSSPFPVMEDVIDPRYLCVSVEHIDFTPLHIDEAVARLITQQEEFNVRFA